MSSSTETYDTGQNGKHPAAILDVDGTLIQGEPLILEGSRHIFEQSVESATGMSVQVEPDPEYFSSGTWDQLQDTLEDLDTDDYFKPGSLENMFRAAYRYANGEEEYLTAARDITWNWREAVHGLEEEEVREYAKRYIEQEMDDRVERDAHNLAGHLSGTHDLYFVSNNPQELLEPFADYLTRVPIKRGNVYGTKVEVDDGGRYKDSLERNMLQVEGKKTAIDDIARKSALDDLSIALGDSEADLPLFREVGIPILMRSNGKEEAETIRRELEGEGDNRRLEVKDSLQDVLDYLYNHKKFGPANGARDER